MWCVQIVPAVTGTATKIVSAKAAALTGLGGTLLKATPIIGPAVASIGKLTATIAIALKAATAVIGIGKIAILPVLIASLVYYNYDFFDPENRPFNVKEVDHEYDFIIVGGGAAGSVVRIKIILKLKITTNFSIQKCLTFVIFSCVAGQSFVRN